MGQDRASASGARADLTRDLPLEDVPAGFIHLAHQTDVLEDTGTPTGSSATPRTLAGQDEAQLRDLAELAMRRASPYNLRFRARRAGRVPSSGGD
ncbi:hypothetical protein LuPra_05066 [Luteitalea pratensis]|uniref:Uncharacterized protein n=1 Tax=Luteitalea pratensis TaxID=1855912 RepID=A0A143PTU0_LUTPR|nr:hypothetical protein [Luteitalea pratensis]AMY11801.1 hypothetical protein LuPra_05066 [Luteitalea pratensis]